MLVEIINHNAKPRIRMQQERKFELMTYQQYAIVRNFMNFNDIFLNSLHAKINVLPAVPKF